MVADIFEYVLVFTCIGFGLLLTWTIDLSIRNRELKRELDQMERQRDIMGRALSAEIEDRLEKAKVREEFERGCG